VDPGPAETIIEFAEWLAGRILHERAYLEDESGLRSDVQLEHRGTLAALLQAQERFAQLEAYARAERVQVAHEDRIDAAYRERYGPDADKLATYQAEGR
jgi:hypothetical protein